MSWPAYVLVSAVALAGTLVVLAMMQAPQDGIPVQKIERPMEGEAPKLAQSNYYVFTRCAGLLRSLLHRYRADGNAPAQVEALSKIDDILTRFIESEVRAKGAQANPPMEFETVNSEIATFAEGYDHEFRLSGGLTPHKAVRSTIMRPDLELCSQIPLLLAASGVRLRR